jgi:hypothetical protein
MPCTRCGGFMVVEFDDGFLQAGQRPHAVRCVNCGHFEDPTIRANKASPQLTSHSGSYKGGQEAGQCSAELVTGSKEAVWTGMEGEYW